jgi:hypothetical protein
MTMLLHRFGARAGVSITILWLIYYTCKLKLKPMLKRIAVFALLAPVLIHLSGCKSDKNPNVGFNTSTVSLDAILHPTSTVTVNVSAATNNIIELWLEMEGPDTLQFGTANSTFLNDDSNRILGALGAVAFIDTPHTNNYLTQVSVPYGTTSFTINLTALFDNFPKRAVTYKIKIYKALNANISGNSELTINIASTPMTPAFSSQLVIPQPNGPLTYTLAATVFAPVGGGKWNFDLNYNLSKGSDSLQSFTISVSSMTPVLGQPQTYADDTHTDSVYTYFFSSPTPSSTRGNYYIMNDRKNAVQLLYKDSLGLGDLQCNFVLF